MMRDCPECGEEMKVSVDADTCKCWECGAGYYVYAANEDAAVLNCRQPSVCCEECHDLEGHVAGCPRREAKIDAADVAFIIFAIPVTIAAIVWMLVRERVGESP